MKQNWRLRRFGRGLWILSLWLLASGTLLSNSLSALARGLTAISLPFATRELKRALPCWFWGVFLSFAIWYLLAGVFAGSSAGYLAHDFSLMLLLPIGAILVAERRFSSLIRLFIWFGVVEALAVIWHAISGASLATLWEPGVRIWAENRPSGFLRSAPTSGQVLGLILPLLLVYRHRSRGEFWLFVMSGGLIGLALILTETRSAWVSALAVLFFVLIIRFGWKRVVPLFFLGSILFWLILPAKLQERALTITDTGAAWARCRTVLRDSGIFLGKQYPVFGVGPGMFKEVYLDEALPRALASEIGQSLTPEDREDVRQHTHPHNDFIQVWAASGLPGLILFSLLILGVFVSGASNLWHWSKFENERFLANLAGLAVFLGAVLIGLVDQTAFEPIRGNLFWLSAGLATGRLLMIG